MTDPRVFDVIIVGAGPDGCVLANRLSADPDRYVLLIDAGADHGSFPSGPRGNLHFPIAAAAEKIADELTQRS